MTPSSYAHRFDDPEDSDIRIKCGSRELHGHLFVIREQSSRFRELCGPGTIHDRTKGKVFELTDDEHEEVGVALVAVLYGCDYPTATSPDTAEFHYAVYTLACEHELVDLQAVSYGYFQYLLSRSSVDTLIHFITMACEGRIATAVSDDVAVARDHRLDELLQQPDFKQLYWQHGSLAAAIVDKLKPPGGLEEHTIERTLACRHIYVSTRLCFDTTKQGSPSSRSFVQTLQVWKAGPVLCCTRETWELGRSERLQGFERVGGSKRLGLETVDSAYFLCWDRVD